MSKALQKNVLFFQNSISPADGGVPRVSDIISRELINRSYKCFFVFYDNDNPNYAAQTKLRVNVKASYDQLEGAVLKFIEDNDINVFICQNTYSTTFIRLFKYLRFIYPLYPFLCFLHASPDYWQISYRLKNDLSKHKFVVNSVKKLLKKIVFPLYNPYIKTTTALYNLCDKFILLSDSFKDSFIKLYGIEAPGSKLQTIGNPLTFSNYITPGQLGNKEKIVLIISRLDESQKKISLALRIWQQVAQNHPDWRLLIVGSGPDEAFYKQYTYDNKLPNVAFLGQQADVIGYHLQSSIFMMTSIWEGLPMALLEAQQNGVVPIAFDNFSAIYDVIKDGESGYIIRENNLEQFALKLGALMDDDKLRFRMAQKSVEGSKSFHVSTIVDTWEKTING